MERRKGHYVIVSWHAEMRLRELWNVDHYEAIMERVDKVWLEAKRDVPAHSGAWWYVHRTVILCVASTADGIPFIITAVPADWTLTKDVHGGNWYWAVGPKEKRKGRE